MDMDPCNFVKTVLVITFLHTTYVLVIVKVIYISPMH